MAEPPIQGRLERIAYNEPWPSTREGYYEDVRGNRLYSLPQTAVVRRNRTQEQTEAQWRRISDMLQRDDYRYFEATNAYRRTQGAMASRGRWRNRLNRW